MINLKEIKKIYTKGSMFLTATKKIKNPLQVMTIEFAKHEDRENLIKEMQNKIIELYNERFNKFAVKYEEVKFSNYSFLAENNNQVLKLREEIEYLQSLPKDIVNSEGGVIYCGENNVWAEVVILNE